MQYNCILCILRYFNTRLTQRGYIATIMEVGEFPSEVTYMYNSHIDMKIHVF